MIKVLPSTNPEREENLVSFARSLMDMGVEYLHCDVMDGLFVENKCLPISKIKEIRDNTNILLDVHLMVSDVKSAVSAVLKLKPNIITIHYEALKNPDEIKQFSRLIRSKDVLFGLSLKPDTPASVLVKYKDYLDLVLIMSVEPGKSGQTFIKSTLQKIKDVKCIVHDDTIIEVDGGINESNFKKVVENGGQFLVMGSAFYNSKDRQKLLYTIDSHY